jgi:hypothetical protein
MPTPNFRYLGDSCGTIHSFGALYPGYKDRNLDANLKAVKRDIDTNTGLDLVAITADYYQTHIHSFLKDNGFRKVVRLKSAHDAPGEHLTMWVKMGTRPRAKTPDRDADYAPYNCSVGFNEDGNRLTIRTKKTKAKGFMKAPHVNIWYKVAARYVLKIKD